MDCNGCTLCCKLLKIDWMDSPAGVYCKECHPGKGCKIWVNIPKKCSEFGCAYNQMKKVSPNMRPDNCGVIFERIADDVFIGTISSDEIKLSDDANGQIQAFLKDGFSMILFHQRIKKPFIYPGKNHTPQQVWDILMEVRNLNGST
jgi:hypothetical protein